MKGLKYLIIIVPAFLWVGFSRITPITEYFFFELKPTSMNMPYYFSQTIQVTYNDSTDLRRQMINYFHELKMEVLADKRDTNLYKSFIPPGTDTKEHCENIKNALLGGLNENNLNVSLKIIHE